MGDDAATLFNIGIVNHDKKVQIYTASIQDSVGGYKYNLKYDKKLVLAMAIVNRRIREYF